MATSEEIDLPWHYTYTLYICNIVTDLTTLQQNDNLLLDRDMTNTSSNEQSINDNNKNLAMDTTTDRVNPRSNDGNTPVNEEQNYPLSNFRSPPN